jgi:two-component system NtrC family response regulator
MPDNRLLILEDDADQRRLVADILRGQDYHISEAASLAEARDQLQRGPIDLILSDLKLPDGDGMELFEEVKAELPKTAFVMVTAYGTISHAVGAVRAGVDDYLAKPFERQALLLAIERTLRSRRLQDENRRLTEELAARDRLVDLVGKAPSMQRLFRRVEKIAGTDATVLLNGESGTGKELAARALHTLSHRADKPFVAINCSAVPEGLLESEFFGAEKGAFTGAVKSRPGKFEAAHEGTLFLDEIGDLPLPLQPKLLRVLQDATVTRIGGNEEISTDVRIIAATNQDLSERVNERRFREDLYYRLNVVPVEMPPLRERREDIPLLVEHFVTGTARRHRINVRPFPRNVLRRLMDYSWPGNVRELANVIERLVLLSEEGEISLDDLPRDLTPERRGGGFEIPPGGMSWEAHEKACLEQALFQAGGNRARAARLLDLPYKAFLYRLEKHKLAHD